MGEEMAPIQDKKGRKEEDGDHSADAFKGKDGSASGYHPLQKLVEDVVQTPIWEDVFKFPDELFQSGEDEGVKGAPSRIRVAISMAFLARCAQGTISYASMFPIQL